MSHKTQNMTRAQVSKQRESILKEHNPHDGVIQSAWVENQGVETSNASLPRHPILSKTVAGAADHLSPVASDPQNKQIVTETSQAHPEKTPVPGPKQQAQAVNAA